MFACEDLACARGGRIIFEKLSFTLTPSQLVLVRGANGSGKTSLLRILAGLMRPAQGKITWQGEPIAGNPAFMAQLTHIGHKNAIKEELSVVDNLSFYAAMHGTEMLLPAAIHYFGLEPFAEMPCRELSAGWQRRVALARLVVAPSSLWLLDEPANFLDSEGIALVGSLIESRVRQQGMVIVATHAAAEITSDQVRVIDLGAAQGQAA